LLVVPWVVVPWVLWMLIGNAAGAIGDLYMLARLTLAPRAVVLEHRSSS